MRLLRHTRRWVSGLVPFAITYFLPDALITLHEHRLGISRVPEVQATLRLIHMLAVVAYIIIYAGYRGLRHPIFHARYRDWLRTTPWHSGMKLPLGNATLGWPDALVLIAALGLVHFHAHGSVAAVLLAFAIPYVCISMMAAISTGGNWDAYGLVFGLAFVARLAPWLAYAAAVAACLCAIAQLVMFRSLARLTVDRDAKPDPALKLGESLPVPIPEGFKPMVTFRAGMAAAVLVGVWLWSLCAALGLSAPPASVASLLLMLAALLALTRFVIYTMEYRPPVKLMGRIRSGRLILPGYDRVFLAPLAATTAAALVPLALGKNGIPAPLSVGATAAVTLTILLCAGPTLRVWQLTGFHRYVKASTTPKREAA